MAEFGIVEEYDPLEMKMEVRNVDLFYGQHQALKGITLPFREQRITAIIGPSGCGKSTLLRCLNRMNDTIEGTRVTGHITLDGDDIYAPGTDVRALRRRVGMVFQRPNPFPLSIFDNIAYGPKVNGLKDKERLRHIVRTSLEGAGLWDDLKDRLDGAALDLSLGLQQQLCVARLLATKPEVILLDEPCSALDPISTLHIEELMRELSTQYTVVIVTHNMQQAARASDYTAFMLAGELIEYGTTAKIFTDPDSERTEAYVTGKLHRT